MGIYYSKTDYTSSKNNDINYNKLSYLQNVRNLLASKVMIIFPELCIVSHYPDTFV